MPSFNLLLSVNRRAALAVCVSLGGVLFAGCGAIDTGVPPSTVATFTDVYPANGSIRTGYAGNLFTVGASLTQRYQSASVTVTSLGFVPVDNANPLMNAGEVYEPSTPIQVNVPIYDTGFEFVDYDAEFTAFGYYGEPRSASSSFQIQVLDNLTGEDDPAARTAMHASFGFDLPPISFAPPKPCEAGELCDNGGGGSGGGGYQQATVVPRPNRSQEPFICVTNDANNDLTRSEVESRIAAWSPQARAFWDAFFSEVYPEEYEGEFGRLAGGSAGVPKTTGERADRMRAAAAGYVEREARTAKAGEARLDLAAVLALIDETEPFLAVRDQPVEFNKRTSQTQISGLTLTAYPNPTAAGVSIRSSSTTPAAVRVFDRLGREVFNASVSAGTSVEWSLRDGSGRRVSAGVYILQVTEGARQSTQTLTIL